MGASLIACEAKDGAGRQDAVAPAVDIVASTAADVGPADVGSTDSGPGELAEEPAPLQPPWQSPSRTLDEVTSTLPTEPIGTLSGELYGSQRPVRAIVRTACGAGTILQAVYENEQGELQVTPAMAVRFLGLGTGRPVEYAEGDFRVTVDFRRDDGELIDGRLEILHEAGARKTQYASLQVKGKPLTTLMSPRVDGQKDLPLFDHCMPNGYLRVVEEDGTEHQGFVHATRLEKSGGIHLRPLLAENTGLQIIVGQRDVNKPVAEPTAFSLAEARQPAPGRDVVVLAEAWWVPQLVAPQEASGVNLGTEKKVQLREGAVSLTLNRPKRRWLLDLTLSDVSIPILMDGPLRGKKLSTVQIVAWPSAPSVIPDELGPAPAWWRTKE